MGRIIALALVLLFTAAACGVDDATDSAPTGVDSTVASTTTVTGPGNDDPVAGVVDLTDQILVSTDANCASYAGEYVSMITDVSSGNQFEGSLTISTTGDTCVFDANQIPNHDTGEGGDFRTPIGEIDASPGDHGLAGAGGEPDCPRFPGQRCHAERGDLGGLSGRLL